MRRLGLILIVFSAVVAAQASVARPYVIGSTPLAAALAATKKHAAHEVVAWNRPRVSYTMGSCRVLHHKPYLAYSCGWKLHGVALYCHGMLTVAVRKQADGQWRAVGVKSSYTDNHGC